MTNESDELTSFEACVALKVTPRTLDRLVAAGELFSLTGPFRQRLFAASDVAELAEQRAKSTDGRVTRHRVSA